jgi:hypothetical protein
MRNPESGHVARADLLLAGSRSIHGAVATHYSTALDIVTIKFVCCGRYYACFYCHQLRKALSVILKLKASLYIDSNGTHVNELNLTT